MPKVTESSTPDGGEPTSCTCCEEMQIEMETSLNFTLLSVYLGSGGFFLQNPNVLIKNGNLTLVLKKQGGNGVLNKYEET